MIMIIFIPRYYLYDVEDEKQNIKKNDLVNKRWLIFSCVIISLVEGLRGYSIGTDTGTYVKYFMSGQIGHFEMGYDFLNILVRSVTNNPTILLLVVAFLKNGLILRAIYKLSRNVAVSLFAYITLYYYFNSFNGLRQYIAIAFVLTSYTYLHENKLLPAVAYILVAMQFHKTSFIGFMLFPIYFNKKRQQKNTVFYRDSRQMYELSEPMKRLKRIALLILIFILFTIGFDTAVNIVINFLPKYSTYFNTEYARGTGAVQQKIVYSVIMLVYLLFSDEEEWMLPMCYAVCFALLMSKISLMSRFLWYFDIFSIFAIAEVWHSRFIEKDTLRYARIAIGLVYFIFMVYYLHEGVMRVTPYRFVLWR